MTDITEHDRKIIEAAEKLKDAFGQHGPWEQQHVQAIVDAVAAKREAARPRLMTAEEVCQMFGMTGLPGELLLAESILHRAHARAFKVIDGLPHYYLKSPSAPPGVMLSDIRAALGVKS